MKVLHIIKFTSKSHGGMPYALLNILKLERDFLNVHNEVLTIYEKELNDELNHIASSVHRFSSNGYLLGNRLAKKWLKAHGGDFDLIQFHGIWNRFILDLLPVSIKCGSPITLWPHCSLDKHDLIKRKYLKTVIGNTYLRSLFQDVSSFIVTSPTEFDNSNFYIKNPKFKVLPLPIPIPNQNDRIEKSLYLNDGKFNFLFLSRFDKKKGLEELIDAFKAIFELRNDIRLILAGSDNTEYSEKIIEKAKNELPNDLVLIPGFLNDSEKQKAFKDAQCFILPSRYENFGISIVESLEAGLPVLITENVYIHNQLTSHDAAWLCGTTKESILESCIRIVDDKDDYKIKKSNAKKAAEQFKPERLANRFESEYKDIINNYKS